MPSPLVTKYMRVNRLPHIWCPGCGIGQIVNGAIRAIDKVGLDQDRTVVVSGIGCSSRATGYLNFDTIHTTHGRALAFATGIKLARPELNVIVIMGDGDCAAIGGNHFIHAARRNIDVTALVINNQIYGMTGGQYSPTTPVEAMATTAPYGDAEPGFDLCGVAQAAGATFVGRVAPVRMPDLINTLAKALQHTGFSFVEAVSQCPVYFGRMNRQGGPVQMLNRQKEITVPVRTAQQKPEEAEGKLLTGVLYESERPAYEKLYSQVRLKASWKAGEHV
ncbi:MAG: thiamine pyrophosphate-dependent enzyme [Chloroflexi bacterium]|nr:thiamine pyrophosphate-dependent enzyme [Chloroflexota bacterium]